MDDFWNEPANSRWLEEEIRTQEANKPKLPWIFQILGFVW